MGRKISVNVRREHIDHALKQTSTQCAAAIALREADEYVSRPRVDQKTIRFTVDDTRYTFETPERIANFIDDFDNGREAAHPFRFTLDLDKAVKAVPIKRSQPSVLLKQAIRDRERRARGLPTQVYNSRRELRSDVM